jgi:hypothetical protein
MGVISTPNMRSSIRKPMLSTNTFVSVLDSPATANGM